MSRSATILHEGDNRGGRPLATRRRPRRSPWLRALRLTACLLMVAGAVWTGRWLLTADLFAIDEVRTAPYRFSDRAAVETELRTALGSNIWTVDTAALGDGLEALPWIRRAVVRRRLPAGLKVTLAEWRPIALVSASGGGEPGMLLENGDVLPRPTHLPAPDLPVLVDDRGDRAGGLGPRETGLVLNLAAAIAETGIEKVCPVDFLLIGPNGMSVVLQQGRGRLVLGRDAFARRLRRYLAVSDRVGDGRVVDLRFDGSVCIRDGRA